VAAGADRQRFVQCDDPALSGFEARNANRHRAPYGARVEADEASTLDFFTKPGTWRGSCSRLARCSSSCRG
jgi:hypothetical protein